MHKSVFPIRIDKVQEQNPLFTMVSPSVLTQKEIQTLSHNKEKADKASK